MVTPFDLPGFGTQMTLERLGGDKDLYQQALKMMLPVLRRALEKIDAAMHHRDQTAALAVVHNIGGIASNAGSKTLAASASRLNTD